MNKDILYNSSNPVYSKFFSERKFFDEYEEELNKKGNASFSFQKCPGEVFKLFSTQFCTAFHQVINGEGKEKYKINTLHSSSLLGLLCFYKVSEKSPLELDLKFDNKPIHFRFNAVKFEKTNRVFSPSVGKSSIDIALYGENNYGQPVVLYLESKFTEYLECGISKSSDKKEQYKGFFETLKNSGCDINYEYKDGKLILSGNHYCEGIKQMVSHFIGAVRSEDDKDRNIYLAPILFNFDKDFSNESFNDYCTIYGHLAKGLNKLKGRPDELLRCFNGYSKVKKEDLKNTKNLFISNKVLTYQELFPKNNNFLDDVVKKYYFL